MAKRRQYQFRLGKDDAQQLDELIQRSGLTPSVFMRGWVERRLAEAQQRAPLTSPKVTTQQGTTTSSPTTTSDEGEHEHIYLTQLDGSKVCRCGDEKPADQAVPF